MPTVYKALGPFSCITKAINNHIECLLHLKLLECYRTDILLIPLERHVMVFFS